MLVTCDYVSLHNRKDITYGSRSAFVPLFPAYCYSLSNSSSCGQNGQAGHPTVSVNEARNCLRKHRKFSSVFQTKICFHKSHRLQYFTFLERSIVAF